MPPDFRPTTPDDLPRIQELLRSAFGGSADAPYLNPAMLRWKYWATGTSWIGSRGYVLEQGGKLLAHVSVWPVKVHGCDAVNLLDWAAVRFPPGMGVALVDRVAELAPILVSTGGSKATRAIMPRIGFQPVTNQNVYVRVLRPWKQHRTRPPEGLQRALSRLVRNALWSVAPPVPLRQWSCKPVDSLAEDAAASHLLSCPAAVVRAWKLEGPARSDGRPRQGRSNVLAGETACPAEQHGRDDRGLKPVGRPQETMACPTTLQECSNVKLAGETACPTLGRYFVLSRVGGQSRIARLRIDSERAEDLQAAYALALRAALEDAEACELAAVSSSGEVNEALEANGFRYRSQRPVFVRERAPSHAGPPELDMLDDDMAYLNVPEYPYFA